MRATKAMLVGARSQASKHARPFINAKVLCTGEDVGHYGGSYKVTYDLYKKFGEQRLLDTPICGVFPKPTFACKACDCSTLVWHNALAGPACEQRCASLLERRA